MSSAPAKMETGAPDEPGAEMRRLFASDIEFVN